MTKDTKQYTASNYRLFIGGRYIRIATQVETPSGQVIKFMDRMPKGKAIKQAKKLAKTDQSKPTMLEREQAAIKVSNGIGENIQGFQI